MATPSSNGALKIAQNILGNKIFAIITAIAGVFLSLFLLGVFTTDRFVQETLSLNGHKNNGENLFKMNCVGCHGITAKGLLGPDLYKLSNRLNNGEIINQIRYGRTPPMPSFETEPQEMADLLAYLDTLKES